MLYKIVYIVSAFVRNFLLPNPYINFLGNETYAELFNVFIGGMILHKLAYWFTGNIYRKSIDDPSIGSFCYLISYVVITNIIMILGNVFNNVIIFITVFFIIYILLCSLASFLFNKINHNLI